MNIDAQLKLNAVRDQRAEAYAQECANRKPTEASPRANTWHPMDALGLQNID